MKVGVVGSRGFNDKAKMWATLKEYNITEIVSGGAVGADKLAEEYANEKGIKVKIFLPDWVKHGKRAGYLRNIQIAEASDMVIAFWDGKSKGTKLTIDICTKANIPVKIVQDYLKEIETSK